MDLLIIFFVLSVGVSFLCSVLESVLLSVNISFVAVLERERPKIGWLLRHQKENINKSIASILILNTIANTLGAAAVGAQASKIFGNDAVVYVSVILTFAILFLSEIIPKTIGAIYWKALAPLASRFIQVFIWITYPIILTTLFVTNKISQGKNDSNSLTKEELLESMLQSEDEGVIDEKESDVIENILNLDNIKVSEVLTPRSVVFALEDSITVKEALQRDELNKFSRFPIFKDSIEDVTGIVMTKDILRQALKDDSVKLSELKEEMFVLNENIPVSKALDLFIQKKYHMFLVTDSYDQTEGIVTLEDCVETILGVEIDDESDTTEDMRALAKHLMRSKRKEKEKRS